MEMLFGLPTHPLLVHFPIVAVPAFALLALWWSARPWFDGRATGGLAVFGLVTAIATFFAAKSGEALAELLNSGEAIDKHRELGETLRVIVIFQAGVVISMMAVATRPSIGSNHRVAMVLRALAAISSILALIWVVRVGHEGASRTWGFLS